jgi:hypothetical protein
MEVSDMPKFTPLSPGNEIKGQIMLGFIHCTEREHLMPFLEKYGLSNIKPDQWYPEKPWVDLLNDLAEEQGAMFDFVSIGMKMAELVPPPADPKSVSFSALMVAWGKAGASEAIYRGPDPGGRKVEVVGEKHLKAIFRYASPDDMMYGFIYSYCRRFLPPGTRFKVQYDEAVLRHDNGGEQTVVNVTWE